MIGPPVARLRGTAPTDAVRTIVFADSPYAVTAQDDILMVDCTDGDVVIVAPSVATLRKAYLNRRLTVKKVDASANIVVVAGMALDLIDGQATVVLDTQYQLIVITNDLGANLWWIIIGFTGVPLSGLVAVTVGAFVVTDGLGHVITIPSP